MRVPFEQLSAPSDANKFMRAFQDGFENEDTLHSRKSHRLRVPMIILNRHNQVLLHDMRTIDDPSVNACTTLPAIIRTARFPETDLGRLARTHLRERVFRQAARNVIEQASVKPLGIYKRFGMTETEKPTDVTSLPLVVRLPEQAQSLPVSRGFNYFRGDALWVPLAVATSLASEQADSMPSNNLARDTADIFNEFAIRQARKPQFAST